MLTAKFDQQKLKENANKPKEKTLEEKIKDQEKKLKSSGQLIIEGYAFGDYELVIPDYEKLSSFHVIKIEIGDISKPSIEKFSLCDGATLKCNQGDASSTYTVLPTKKVYVNGKPLAVISDIKPMVNIKPFGQCKSMANPTVAAATAANRGQLKKMPCMPNTVGIWSEGISHFLSSEMTPCDKSKCMCAYAGEISVSDVGQKILGTSSSTSSKDKNDKDDNENNKSKKNEELSTISYDVRKSYKKNM